MKRKELEKKTKLMLAGIILVFLVLLIKISFLQLIQTEQYRTLARNNYIRIVPVFAPRGEIFDRDGKKMVTSRPIYTVSVNDVNIKGTTYHVVLERVGADTVRMVEQLAGVLARDPEYRPVSRESVQQNLKTSLAEALDMKPGSVAVEQSFTDIGLDAGVGANWIGEFNKYYGTSFEPTIIYNYKNIGELARFLEPELNRRHIGEEIKELIKDNKTELEEGNRLELAVLYNPAAAAELSGGQWESYGVRVEEKVDILSKLVALLYDKGIFEEDSPYAVEQRIRKEIKGKKPYESTLVAEDIPLETVVELRERKVELPGVVTDIQPVRDYPYNELLTHVLGYVQSIKSEQYQKHKDEGYLMTDLYGQDGLEMVFESYLRGEHGARQVEVDTYNRPVRDLDMKPPVPGNDLVLTVDLELQRAAEKALAAGVKRAQDAGHESSRSGAAVAMDVNTGAIRAMASYPAYNPGVFTGGLSNEQWRQLQESRALLNRAMSSYPPGSTFKMVTAAAILEENAINPEYEIHDPGYYMLGRRYNCWKPGGHGMVDLRKAIQVSCNTYFWSLSRQAGVDSIAHYAREFGLGQVTGIELPGEMAGIVPDPAYKYDLAKSHLIRYNADFAVVRELNRRIERAAEELKEAEDNTGEKRRLDQLKQELEKERDQELAEQLNKYAFDLNWQAYDTLNMSVGQGYNLCTPLQLASFVTAIANGGTLYKPYLVNKVVSPGGEVLEEYDKEVRRKVNIKPENLQIIQEGMHMAAMPPGTAAGAFAGFEHTAAAKTGTAQVTEENHALFVAYAPYEKPEIAVAVVLEYGYSGSGFAGPIARQMLDVYFGADIEEVFPAENQDSETGGEEPGQGEAGTAIAGGLEALQASIDNIPAVEWPHDNPPQRPEPAPAPVGPATPPVDGSQDNSNQWRPEPVTGSQTTGSRDDLNQSQPAQSPGPSEPQLPEQSEPPPAEPSEPPPAGHNEAPSPGGVGTPDETEPRNQPPEPPVSPEDSPPATSGEEQSAGQ
ncbi:MAG: penicillin-binding protein 2 [Firmicutes bacterium]|nr:penicillin-binding protein 2 [Bacillota bacterium]